MTARPIALALSLLACGLLTTACSKKSQSPAPVASSAAGGGLASANATAASAPAPGPGATSANLTNDVSQTAAVSPPAYSNGHLPPSPGVGQPGGVPPSR